MSNSSYELLKLEREGHVVIITLNPPEKLNAMNAQLRLELQAVLDEVAADDDARVLILTGHAAARL